MTNVSSLIEGLLLRITFPQWRSQQGARGQSAPWTAKKCQKSGKKEGERRKKFGKDAKKSRKEGKWGKTGEIRKEGKNLKQR